MLTIMLPFAAACAVAAQDSDAWIRETLQRIRKVDEWSAPAWERLLAEDVTLVLRAGGRSRWIGGTPLRTEIQGKEKVTKALQKLHEEYRGRVTIGSEFLSGRRAALVGDVRAKDGAPEDEGLLVVILLNFDPKRGLERLTITSFPLKEPSAEPK